jgi:DNA-directed RNA polymerase specialized sigma24 family protein
VTTERRRDRRRGGRSIARRDKPRAESSAGLLATIYRSNYPADDPTPSEQIDAIRQLRERLDEEEQQIVFGLRLRQTSWQIIGDMFGITRQAAQQRFAIADKLGIAFGGDATP